jgi:hypothetical protein
MISFNELTGKKLALVVLGDDEKGETEGAVFTGLAQWVNGHLYLERGRNQKPFQLPDDTLERIKPVPADIKDIVLEAEYYLTMSIGPLPEDANPNDYIETGLKWPK